MRVNGHISHLTTVNSDESDKLPEEGGDEKLSEVGGGEKLPEKTPTYKLIVPCTDKVLPFSLSLVL